jgi:predicted GNAT family N-acyltransferase
MKVEVSSDLERCLQVRWVVFVEEQRVPPELERDALDAEAIHVLATGAGGEAIGTGRLVLKGDGVGKIGRVAVLPAARGAGVGAALMDRLTTEAQRRGLREIVLDAQESAISFYLRLGYQEEGERFLDAGIWHRRMRRAISPPR